MRRKTWRLVTRAGWALALLLAASPGRAVAGTEFLPTLYTNEQYVSDVTGRSDLDVGDVRAVFEYVLGELPARVRVFPTENYYYFYFYQGGIKYAGNLRFDVERRDQGLVEFVYFKDSTDWQEDEHDYHATLGNGDGVLVEKVEPLLYRVTLGDRSVLFELNDLSGVRPPANVLREREKYLGPVADESGIRFFLVIDEDLEQFHYILDETVPVADELVAAEGLDRILIGRRTGFAFFADSGRGRKVLVGVYEPNVAVNNYLDGPFDQLPDNFLKGDELRQALLLTDPTLAGTIDRLGIAPGGASRESIGPYIEYLFVEELAPAQRCASEAAERDLYSCLGGLVPD